MFDEYQQEAINTIEGPVLCAAGPGSGKTTVIVNRTLNMVKNGIDPKSIIVMTFTSDAAKEMESRYYKLEGSVQGPSFCTIHSFAFMVCRECYGYTRESVLQTVDAMKFIKKFLRDNTHCYQNVTDLKKTTNLILGDISRYTIMEDKSKFKPSALDKEDFIELYKGYMAYKNMIKKIDFDDMLILCRNAILKPDIKEYYQNRYHYIMVDEFQDTSKVQADILYAIAEKHRNIFICGDDDQSIYGFRNAKPDIMLNFPEDYPECKVIKLSVNYRSDSDIVTAAQSLIKNNNVRIKKDISGKKTDPGTLATMTNENARLQNKSLVGFIEKYHPTTPYSEMAVLCRTNKEISTVAKCLSDNGIPFTTKEQINNVHDTWVYETLIAYLKIAYGMAETQDRINAALKPTRYFKKDFLTSTGANIQRMKEQASRDRYLIKNVFSFEDDLKEVEYIAKNNSFRKACRKIAKYLLSVGDWIKDTCSFQKLDATEYYEILEELLLEMEEFGSLEEYLEYVEAKDATFEENVQSSTDDGVTISTMHRAKGREWDIVMIPSVNTGNIPYIKPTGDEDDGKLTKENEEEERRLFYVAITRAREFCAICFIDEKDATEKKANKSYFLSEIEQNQALSIKKLDSDKFIKKTEELEEEKEKERKRQEEITKLEQASKKAAVNNEFMVPHVPTVPTTKLDTSCPFPF